MESIYLQLIIFIISVEYILSTTAQILNLNHRKTAKVPDQLRDVYSDDQLLQSRQYRKKNAAVNLISSTLSTLLILLAIIFGWFGSLDALSKDLMESNILQGYFFFGFIFLLSELISLPFQLYSVFVVEERFGFNKTTLKTFILDKIKGYLISAVLVGGIFYVFMQLVEALNEDFWWIFWLFITLIMIGANYFYTTLIVPLFNKLTPLEDGDLKEKIIAYGQSVDFPIQNIFVIDGSKRSTKANAFFSGFGKNKKIVLYDTLIERHSNQELVSILAHEVGHYKKKHTIIGMLEGIISVGFMLFLLSVMLFSKDLSQALGANSLSIPLNLVAFGFIYTPISLIIGLIGNFLSRKHEYEADEYASKTYSAEALIKALKKLSADNLSNIYPHPLYIFLHYTHPPLLHRIAALHQKA